MLQNALRRAASAVLGRISGVVGGDTICNTTPPLRALNSRDGAFVPSTIGIFGRAVSLAFPYEDRHLHNFGHCPSASAQALGDGFFSILASTKRDMKDSNVHFDLSGLCISSRLVYA